MGKFINTEYTKAIDKISDISKTFLNNPYYMWNDKKPTTVTYYHINNEMSTMDESLRIPYNDIGRNSPFRYNKIKKFLIYGIEKIALALQMGDDGFWASEITGDGIILPGTIDPFPNDYFEIDLATKVDHPYLFRVISVDKDTLDNGSNIWKIEYKLEHVSNEDILPLTVADYTMIPSNVGTRYTPILKSDKYDLVEGIDNVCTVLKQYYVSLFYRTQVQTFIFVNYGEDLFYDPYMIEFLIRNEILAGLGNNINNNYIYIDHKIAPIKTFALDYNRTWYKALEDKDLRALQKARFDSTANYIDDFGSIFYTRAENYFKLNYYVDQYDSTAADSTYHNIIETFPKKIIPKIIRKDLYTDAEVQMNHLYGLYNILIKFFNDIDITEKDYYNLENMEFSDGVTEFYMIPAIIFCLEKFEKGLLEKNPYQNLKIGELPDKR